MLQDSPFEGLARQVSKALAEKLFAIRLSGDALRVSNRQLPEVYDRVSTVAKRLD